MDGLSDTMKKAEAQPGYTRAHRDKAMEQRRREDDNIISTFTFHHQLFLHLASGVSVPKPCIALAGGARLISPLRAQLLTIPLYSHPPPPPCIIEVNRRKRLEAQMLPSGVLIPMRFSCHHWRLILCKFLCLLVTTHDYHHLIHRRLLRTSTNFS